MMRRRELMGMQGVLKTATGPIVTVNDALARNAKSLVVNFAPVQAAGTPAPDNVLPISGWTGVTGYRSTTNILCTIDDGYYSTFIPKGATVTASCDNSPGGTKSVYCYAKDKTLINYLFLQYYSGNRAYRTFTVDTDVYYIKFSSIAENVQLEFGSTPTPYAPYTGTTYPVTFPAVGKNLLDSVTITANKTIYTNGTIGNENGESITDYIPVVEGEKYALSAISGESGRARRIYGYDSNKDPVSSLASSSWVTTGTAYTLEATIPSGVSYIRSCYFTNDTDKSLKNQDNTVYGGYVDLVSGVLTATWKGIVYDGSLNENWMLYGRGSASTFAMQIALSNVIKNLNATIVANYLKRIYSNDTWGNYDNWISTNASNYLITGIQSITTVDAWKAYLAEHPLTIVYELNTPKTYQLDPQTVAMLKGTNNVWSNANGNLSLTYIAKN